MKYRKIYFVGIKGVGMASLAIIVKQAGFIVGGSDLSDEFITDCELEKEKIYPLIGFSEKNIKEFSRNVGISELLVVCTSANLGFNNLEAVWAKENGYRVITHGQAVGEFMKGEIFARSDIEGISVSGCHGKTTISAMLATYFTRLGLDPSYSVGTSEIFPIGSAGHYGSGHYFIAEADEYASEMNFDKTPKFLYQHPKIAVINNIDFDHPDFYKDIEEVENAYVLFSNNVSKDGLLIVNGDDRRVRGIIKKTEKTKKVITYGSNSNCDFYISKYSQDGLISYFSVESKDIYLGDFKLSVPGFHNATNSLAAIIILLELGISCSKIKELLPQFLGTKRRIEIIGKTVNKTIIIDDYAHHPKEIKTSLSVIKKAFPKKKILCVFQPHTYSRTKALMNDFVSSFFDAHVLILMPVFASLRENENSTNYFSISEELLNKIRVIKSNVFFLKEPDFVIKYIQSNYDKGDFVVVTMGAGDVYKISQKLKLPTSSR